MKKSLAIATVSLISFAASAGVTKADYPPVQEVRPSTIVPVISYDRTPASIVKSARRIISAVPVGTSATVDVFAGEPFLLVLSGVGAAQMFTVRITTTSGRSISLPNVRSLGNGNLRLSTLSISRGGTYTVKVTSENGKVRTLKIRVAK
jgi:hypothetical protein